MLLILLSTRISRLKERHFGLVFAIFVAVLLIAKPSIANDSEILIKKIETGNYSRLADFGPLKKEIQNFLKDKHAIEDISEAMAEKLVTAASRGDLAGVDPSKLYYLAEAAVRRVYFKEKKFITDVTWIPEYGRVIPVILSTHTIDNMKLPVPPQGIYSRRLQDIYFDVHGEKYIDYQWTTNGKDFATELVVRSIPIYSNLVTDQSSPNYDGYWKNDKRTGLIFLSTNLGREEQLSQYRQFFKFYQDRGFHFSEVSRKFNLKNFLKETIISGELDYLVKNAHTGGNDKNVFQTDTHSRLYLGIKQHPTKNGEEQMYLVVPDPSGTAAEWTSINEFGYWLREREKNHGGELFYLSGSCTSYSVAIKEIQAARTPLLVNIPTLGDSIFFFNDPKSGMYHLLESLLADHNFASMQLNLRSSRFYEDGDDHYIFPGTDEYRKEIMDKIRTPVEVDIKIFDGKRQAYNPPYR